MRALSIFTFIYLFLLVSSEKEEKPPLPPCKHIDPYKNLNEWLQQPISSCNYTTSASTLETPEKELYQFGIKHFAFDSFASEKLGPRRNISNQAHKLCSSTKFEPAHTASIIIIHHNEALSVLLRMLVGIFEKTPSELLKEIILYEDASEEPHRLSDALRSSAKLMNWEDKMIIERTEERQGLIRAKVVASRLASADLLIFLDSHCEVTEGWIEPLLDPIREDRKNVVLPIVDLINPLSFDYGQAMVSKSGFDWALNFKWIYLPWTYFDIEENNVKPFESPSMSGGLLAIHREYFRELGEYDMGMEIWGAENVELSLKVWMCGGRVLVAPCSRIGHVFRLRRPYKGKPGVDTNLVNSVRVANAWLGEYKENFFKARPQALKVDAGDVSYVDDIKKRMNCKDMKWFIQNIYPELQPPKAKDEL